MTYATAAATTPCRKRVDFLYTEQIPSTTIAHTRPPVGDVVNPNLYKTIADAQDQFPESNADLKDLNMSGEINEYTVSAADGDTVQFKHQNTLGTRFLDLKGAVRDLRRELKEVKENFEKGEEIMMQWQVTTALLEGLCQKIWSDITQADKELLSGLGIHDVQTVFASRFTCGRIETNCNRMTHRIYNTISEDNRSNLQELNEIKHKLGKTRTSLAHPDVSVSDLRKFIEKVNPSSGCRLMLQDMETMEVWRHDKKERLFAD